MADELEEIKSQMEDTRASLAGKLEALEQQVLGTVEGATETVAQTVETVKETVETVKETFNLSRHVERHPWVALGGAITVGYVAGSLLGGQRTRRVAEAPVPAAAPLPVSQPAPPTNGSAHRNGAGKKKGASARPAREEPGPFDEGLKLLRGLAVGALMGMLRQAVSKSLPENMTPDVSTLLDDWTTRLGGKPLPPLERREEEPAHPRMRGADLHG